MVSFTPFNDAYSAYRHYLGDFRMPEKPYSDNREVVYHDWPAALNGPNNFIRNIIINRITEEELWPLRELASFEEWKGDITIEWTTIIFNRHPLGLEPEEGVARLMTSSQDRDRATMQRYGIGLKMEMGFWQTPAGAVYYYAALAQIASATADTACALVLKQVFHPDLTRLPKLDRIKNLSSYEEMNAAIREHVKNFGLVIKSDRPAETMEKIMSEVVLNSPIRRRVNIIMGPQELLTSLGSHPSNRFFYLSGKESVGTVEEIGQRLMKGVTVRAVDGNYGNEPAMNGMATRVVEVGEIQTADFKWLQSVVENENFKTHMLDMKVFDWEADQFRVISYKRHALEKMGLFDIHSGDDDMPLTQLGAKFFQGTTNLFDWFKAMSQLALSLVVKKFQRLGAHTQREFVSRFFPESVEDHKRKFSPVVGDDLKDSFQNIYTRVAEDHDYSNKTRAIARNDFATSVFGSAQDFAQFLAVLQGGDPPKSAPKPAGDQKRSGGDKTVKSLLQKWAEDNKIRQSADPNERTVSPTGSYNKRQLLLLADLGKKFNSKWDVFLRSTPPEDVAQNLELALSGTELNNEGVEDSIPELVGGSHNYAPLGLALAHAWQMAHQSDSQASKEAKEILDIATNARSNDLTPDETKIFSLAANSSKLNLQPLKDKVAEAGLDWVTAKADAGDGKAADDGSSAHGQFDVGLFATLEKARQAKLKKKAPKSAEARADLELFSPDNQDVARAQLSFREYRNLNKSFPSALLAIYRRWVLSRSNSTRPGKAHAWTPQQFAVIATLVEQLIATLLKAADNEKDAQQRERQKSDAFRMIYPLLIEIYSGAILGDFGVIVQGYLNLSQFWTDGMERGDKIPSQSIDQLHQTAVQLLIIQDSLSSAYADIIRSLVPGSFSTFAGKSAKSINAGELHERGSRFKAARDGRDALKDRFDKESLFNTEVGSLTIEDVHAILRVTPINGKLLQWWMDHDMPPLFFWFKANANNTLRMGTVAGTVGGGAVYRGMYSNADFQLAGAIVQKTIEGHFTIYVAGICFTVGATGYVVDAVPQGYMFGGGIEAFDPTNVQDIREWSDGVFEGNRDQRGTKSAFYGPMTWNETDNFEFIDLSGKLQDRHVVHGTLPSASDCPIGFIHLLASQLGIDKASPMPFQVRFQPESMQPSQRNTLLLKGLRYLFEHTGNGNGSFTNQIVGNSVFGPNQYNGMKKHWTGTEGPLLRTDGQGQPAVSLVSP